MNNRMKKHGWICLTAMTLCLLTGCESENPLDKEQYKKIVYLVGASDHVVTRKLSYSPQEQETFISVAIGGSRPTGHNVSVGLTSRHSVIAWYNEKFNYLSTDLRYQLLDEAHYSLPSATATIPAGEVYTRVPVKIRTEGLHCDSLYALTFAIGSVSDYEINESDSALILTFDLENDYSGPYLFAGTRYTLNADGTSSGGTSMSVVRTLKAVDANRMRFYNQQQSETVANIRENCITLTIEANNHVSIAAWEDFPLEEGTCTYDSEKGVFHLNYIYQADGQRYRVDGKLTKDF